MKQNIKQSVQNIIIVLSSLNKRTPLISTLGKRRTIYLIADSSVLSDRNAGLDFESPHAYYGKNNIILYIYKIVINKLTNTLIIILLTI